MLFHSTSQKRQRGAAAVEFAVVAPIFVLMFFGIVEFGRGMMVQQVIIQASREGAREAALPGATLKSVKDVVQRFADSSGVKIKRKNIIATPNPSTATNNEPITVVVDVAAGEVSWIPNTFIRNRLRASTTMRAEGLD